MKDSNVYRPNREKTIQQLLGQKQTKMIASKKYNGKNHNPGQDSANVLTHKD